MRRCVELKTFDHLGDDRRIHAARAQRQQHLVDDADQAVADVDRLLEAEGRLQRRPSPAHRIVVFDVVVRQAGGVHHFGRHDDDDRGVGGEREQAAEQAADERAQPFTARQIVVGLPAAASRGRRSRNDTGSSRSAKAASQTDRSR
jgi:hypothetical protein